MLDQVDYQARSTACHEVGECVQDARSLTCSWERLRLLNLISRRMFCLCLSYDIRSVVFNAQQAGKMCSQLVPSDGCDNSSNFPCLAHRPALVPDRPLEAYETRFFQTFKLR